MAGMGDGYDRIPGVNPFLAAVVTTREGCRRHQGDGCIRADVGSCQTDACPCDSQSVGRRSCVGLYLGIVAHGAASQPAPNPLRRLSGLRRTQRGIYALEFGLVFAAFFLVLYSLVTYGMIDRKSTRLNSSH